MGSAVVAFTDPQGVFGRYEKRVEDNLQKLTTLHWRPSNSALDIPAENAFQSTDTTIRTVPQLKLQLIPEGTQKQRQHQIPGLNNSPLVQILIIETVPLDLYRTKLRQIGKEWFQKQVEVREPTGYVVVHAATSEDNAKNSKAVWSRITTEFDSANCIQLVPTMGDSWVKLRSLVQEQLVDAFDSRVNMLHGEIKKQRATQDVPGWNIGTLFALYESLAWAYESMNLFDDALKVYTGLESMINDIPRNSWPPEPHTANIALLGDRDALIDPILEQKASLFDIERHLLSRKFSLLLNLANSKRQQEKMVDSLADKYVLNCITMTISKIPILLESLIRSLDRRRAYLWLLKAIREVFSLTAEAGSAKFVQGKGDLALIERDALQNLGYLSGWSIPGLFNDVSLDEVDEKETDGAEAHPEYQLDELRSEAAFQAEFLRLTQSAISYFQSAGLLRAVTRLTGQLVHIEYNKGNVKESWNILQKTPKLLELSPQQPAINMLDIAMRCATKLNMEDKIVEFAWRIICFDGEVPPSLFVRAVSTAEKLGTPKPENYGLSKWFEPKLSPYVLGDEKGYYVEVELLPKKSGCTFVSLSDAEVVAYVSTEYGSSKKKVVFNSREVKISQPLKLYTRTFVEGILHFDYMEVRHKDHSFEHNLDGLSGAMRPLSKSFTAQITLSKQYTMKKRNIDLRLSCPKMIKEATISMHPADPQLQLLWEKADGLQDLKNFDARTISVPVLVDHENPRSRLRVIIEYDGRSFEVFEKLDFSLAVSVDFQEYFRQPPLILSQFMVKPFSKVPAVFVKASLDGSVNYEASPLNADVLSEEHVAYDNAPVSYIFNIAKLEEADRSKSRSMQLTLTYRSVLWECQDLFYEAALEALEVKGLRSYSPIIGRITEQLCAKADIVHYMTTGKVQLADAPFINLVVNSALQLMNPRDVATISSVITDVLAEGVVSKSSRGFEHLNSTMKLDVPDPDAEIVHYVQLETHKTDNTSKVDGIEQYVVGSVIPATLRIQTLSFIGSDLSERYFEYELHRISDGWSYTGKVKGAFKGTEKVHESIDLIPNRSGELLLPSVMIRPLHDQNGVSDEASEKSVSVVDPIETVVVTQHANNQVLIVPDLNMLAITF